MSTITGLKWVEDHDIWRADLTTAMGDISLLICPCMGGLPGYFWELYVGGIHIARETKESVLATNGNVELTKRAAEVFTRDAFREALRVLESIRKE